MLLSMAYEPKYNTIIGLGHATYGSNPDYTYDHYGKFEKENLVGFGDWTVNEQRSLMEQEQVYLKLVEYRRNILKIPDNKTKVVPWSDLSKYLQAFNVINEHHDDKSKGSLDSWVTKITYLQNLLNGRFTSNVHFTNQDIPGIPSPNWGYKTKQGNNFKFISLIPGTTNKGVGIDGFSVPQAINNRIKVFSTLTDKQVDEYKNVIWDTSVKKYKTMDGEDKSIVNSVQGYRP